MQACFHKVPVALQNSFSIRHDRQPVFPTTWHYHPELELHFVKKGEGVRFIGDNISNFSEGEMLLLGENLPHSWLCRDEYFDEHSQLEVEAIVLHFLPNCLGKDFLDLPETYLINNLFERAKKGIVIKGKTKETILELMPQALIANSLDRIIILLTIIKTLAESDECESISSSHAFYRANTTAALRLNEVFAYTYQHFRRNITLEEIAAVSNLSVTSFCRYFKMMTKKTYFDFLTEVRISHACRYLIEDKFATNVICYQCGFNNISNFYRHFKKIAGMTPFHYRRKYMVIKN